MPGTTVDTPETLEAAYELWLKHIYVIKATGVNAQPRVVASEPGDDDGGEGALDPDKNFSGDASYIRTQLGPYGHLPFFTAVAATINMAHAINDAFEAMPAAG